MALFGKNKVASKKELPSNVIVFENREDLFHYAMFRSIDTNTNFRRIENTSLFRSDGYMSSRVDKYALSKNILYLVEFATEMIDHTYNNQELTIVIESLLDKVISFKIETNEDYAKNNQNFIVPEEFVRPYTIENGAIVMKKDNVTTKLSNYKITETITQMGPKTIKVPVHGYKLEEIGRYYPENLTLILKDGVTL